MSLPISGKHFYASTPQSSPPATPRSAVTRRGRKPAEDQTLLATLRTAIETRNFPNAMEIIRKMEKFDAVF